MRDLRRVSRPSRALWNGVRVGLAGLVAPLCCAAQHALPEAPSALLAPPQSLSSVSTGTPSSIDIPDLQQATQQPLNAQGQTRLPSCPKKKPAGSPPAGSPVIGEDQQNAACVEENPLQPIIASKELPGLSSTQKAYLAGRDVIDPFNLVTIVGYSGIVVASNAHTAYGPGFRGFGRLTGYSLVEDMQGEFFGTFLIPSLAHQDPRYYRMPGRPLTKRLLNAVSHTVITRHDNGDRMLNYATLLTYPISAELTNLYVPGVQTDGTSTAKRIGLGLATDPVGQIVAEFLPDFAKRIHIRVIFVQQILQQVAQGSTGGAVASQ